VKQLRHSETENILMSSSSDQAAAAESQKFRELLGLGVEKKVEPKAIDQTVRQHFLRNKTTMSLFSEGFKEEWMVHLMQFTYKLY
jgi:hypothetical protein